MSRLRNVATGLALLALVAVLTPIWFVHDRATRALSARRVGRRADLPRVAADAVSLEAVMSAGRPVILTGLSTQLDLADAATPASLVAVAGDDEITVTLHDAAAPYFLYSGGYGATPVQRRTMSMAAFIQTMFHDGLSDEVVAYQLLGARSVGGKVAAVLDEFDRALRGPAGRPTEVRFSGVWIGSTGAVTPLHHDAWPGLLFQTQGRKRVAMFAPRDRANLYFRTPLRGSGRWSDLPGRSADADVSAFPRLAHAVRFEGELRPGDALFIPSFWAHEMEALESNVSVPFRFAGPPTNYLNPGFLRPASEMLRQRLLG